MKNIRYQLSLILLIFTFYSCNKDKDGHFIKAGSHPIQSYYDYYDVDTVRNLDIDRDGQVDFRLQGNVFNGNNGYTAGWVIANMNESSFDVLRTEGCDLPGSNYVKLLDDKVKINENMDWSNLWLVLMHQGGSYIPPYSPINCNYWTSKTGYVGVRKKVGDNEYRYGWLKLRMNDYKSGGYFLGYCLLK